MADIRTIICDNKTTKGEADFYCILAVHKDENHFYVNKEQRDKFYTIVGDTHISAKDVTSSIEEAWNMAGMPRPDGEINA